MCRRKRWRRPLVGAPSLDGLELREEPVLPRSGLGGVLSVGVAMTLAIRPQYRCTDYKQSKYVHKQRIVVNCINNA
jgi:hypothetical protein